MYTYVHKVDVDVMGDVKGVKRKGSINFLFFLFLPLYLFLVLVLLSLYNAVFCFAINRYLLRS